MPCVSEKNKLLSKIDTLKLDVMTRRKENLQRRANEEEYDSEDEDRDLIFLTPLTPLTPFLSDFGSESDQSWESFDSTEARNQHYERLLGAIEALRDEVERARVLTRIAVPLLHASQLHLLDHFADYRPHLFRQRVRVNPEIFDCILNRISDNPVFKSRSNRLQLPVAVQLAIFLNRAGHYGNAISTEDVAQWAGISVGSVVNCTNRVMAALLDQHDEFVFMPSEGSLDAELARMFVEAKSCTAWRGGIFAVDGSTFNLFEKPSLYGETFYDRKSRYSLNCQVRKIRTCVASWSLKHQGAVQIVVMPHNLLIVDYGLGHPGSVHDAYAFQGTEMARNPEALIPEGHWIWADSAYPTRPWCVVPFKTTRTSALSRQQKVYNRYLSKVRFGLLVKVSDVKTQLQVRVCVEHAFAALKGRFQSLRELRIRIRSQDDMTYAVHWVQCCIILHNMIIRFEDTLGRESTMGWAREEARDLPRDLDPVVMEIPDGTPGQRFRVKLMREMLAALA